MVTVVRVTPELVEAGLPPVAPDVFDDDLTPEGVAAFVARSECALIVAVDEVHGIVGQCVGYLLRDVAGRTSLYIDNLGVTPAHRRRGVGRRLIEECCALGSEMGCGSAWLVTEPDNDAAVGLYRSMVGSESAVVMFGLP